MAGKGSLTALTHLYHKHLRPFGKKVAAKRERNAAMKLVRAEKRNEGQDAGGRD